MRHIAFVTETYAPEVNGVAMTLGKLVDGLLNRGWTVEVFRPRQRPDEQPRVNGHYAEHLCTGMQLPMYRDLRFGFPAGGLLRGNWQVKPPDVVYIATEGPLGWSAAGIARSLGIRTLSGFHTNFHTYSRHYHLSVLEPLILTYLRRLHRRTGCTLVPTAKLAAQLRQLDFGRVEVLPRGVDGRVFHPERRDLALRRQWGAGEDDLVCLYVGRIAAEKNIATAVAAFRAVNRRVPAARLVLVGDGPLRASLARDNPDIFFCGTRRGEDLARHYASADLFLFPSRSETFGNVVTEAMASGLAVTAYDLAAAGEHLRHGENGILISGDDEAAFVAAAEAHCEDIANLRQIGANAADYALGLSWDGIVQRFERLLQQEVRQ